MLRGETVGYRHHPQLYRFRDCGGPCYAINAYLAAVLEEAESRGYDFDRAKVGPIRPAVRLAGTAGQLDYEWRHLLRKLRARNPEQHRRWRRIAVPDAHPLFRIRPGAVELWERP